MGKIIAVASGKGGTGKTTSVAAISSCLAILGYKTLCIDFDAGMKNLDLSLCMADFAVTDYMDVASGRMDLMEACSESPQIQKLYFLAAPAFLSQAEPEREAMKAMFGSVRDEFDYCLVDSPSGLGQGFRMANENADMAIIVTFGELPAMRNAQQAANEVREMGVGERRLLVNRVMPKNLKRIHSNIDDVIDTVGARLIGLVPEDKAVFRALHANVPLILYKQRLSVYDYLDIARRITGEEVPLRHW